MECKQHHEPPYHPPHIVCVRNHQGIVRAQNISRSPLICTAAVVEDRGTGQTRDNDIVLLSYRPRNSMYNAVLRACRVKWGTS